MKVSFNGNYLIKFPSKRARDISALHILWNTNSIRDLVSCSNVEQDKLHILTGNDYLEETKMCRLSDKLWFKKELTGKDWTAINDCFVKT